MIAWLAFLQFPFLYLSHFLLGLGVYGSDFGAASGKSSLLALAVMALLFVCHKRAWCPQLMARALLPLQLLAIVAGIYLSSVLQYAYWDEHSLLQAVLVMLLGLGSAMIALASLAQLEKNASALAQALLVIAVAFMANRFYPLIGFFFISIILIALCLSHFGRFDNHTKITALPLHYSFLLWFVFFEAFTPLWDYQEVTLWAYHFSLFFVALAVIVWRRVLLQPFFLLLVLLTGAVLCSALFPQWVLSYSHAVVFGILAGLLLIFLMEKSGYSIPAMALSMTSSWFWAGFLSFAWYQNITRLEYRVLLLFVPWLLVLYQGRKQSKSL